MWKYESDDWENISLHDHTFDRTRLDGDDIMLVFDDGFDVVKTHHLNDTEKSKHTTASQIILKNGKLIKGTILRYIGSDRQGREEEIDLAWLLNFAHGIEVLKFSMENNVFMLFSQAMYEGEMEFLTLEISCSDVLFCWNDYSADAWFEGWSKNV